MNALPLPTTNGPGQAFPADRLFFGPSVAGIVLPQPATPITLGTLTATQGQITFAWTGGVGPFQVQKKPSLSSTAWQDLGAPTMERTVTDPAGGSAAFYRVLGQ